MVPLACSFLVCPHIVYRQSLQPLNIPSMLACSIDTGRDRKTPEGAGYDSSCPVGLREEVSGRSKSF